MAHLGSGHVAMLLDSAGDQADDQAATERASLLRTSKNGGLYLGNTRSRRNRIKSRYCLKSKGALIILCWNMLVVFMLGPWLNIDTYSLIADLTSNTSAPDTLSLPITVPSFYGFQAVLYLLYPLAGCLADTKCGRYKTIICSLWLLLWSGIFVAVGATVFACYFIFRPHVKMPAVTISLLSAIFGLPSIIGVTLLFICFAVFQANVFQFGVDQLTDSPAEDSVLFIQWLVFSSFVGITVTRLGSIPYILQRIGLLQLTFTTEIFAGGVYCTHMSILLLLLITLCLVRRKRQLPWFTTESVPCSGKLNPYSLVYRVIKFAARHKTPIRRSAFTYCEDELPSRMDLGKEKYGGPFTTEQVEDVKAFLGILLVLLTLGPLFGSHLTKGCTHSTKEDLSNSSSTSILIVIFGFSGITDLLIAVLIPVYIFLLRPFISHCLLGMLKRIGLGMTFLLLLSICELVIDTTRATELVHVSVYIFYLVLVHFFSAIGYILFYIAAYEFISAQSPQTMKGLLIGTFFAVRGVSQLLGTVVLVSLSTRRQQFDESTFSHCNFVYSVINIAVSALGLVAYTCVARRYRYRQRDEPDNVYHYAEEYYSR